MDRRQARVAVRRVVKTAGARLLELSGVQRAVAAAQRRRSGGARVYVLAWHRVVPDYGWMKQRVIPGLLTSASTFDRQLAWLGERFRFVTLAEALEVLAGRAHAARDICAITFDDGYADFLECAVPLLHKHQVQATVYVPSGFVETQRPLLHDRLFLLLRRALAGRLQPSDVPAQSDLREVLQWAVQLGPKPALERMLETLPRARCVAVASALEHRLGVEPSAALADSRLLSWEQLRAVRAAGHEVGGHTIDHACLPNETPRETERQLRESKAHLEAELGAPVLDFAYPNGWYSPGAIRALRACGYRSAVTTEDQPNGPGENPYAIKRKYVNELSSQGVFGFSGSVTACNLDDTLRTLGLSPWVRGERPDAVPAEDEEQAPPADSPLPEPLALTASPQLPARPLL